MFRKITVCCLFSLLMSAAQAAPSGALEARGVLATFRTAGAQTFHSYITDPASIDDAITVWRRPATRKRIPVGQLSCTATSWNAPWHWQQIPATVRFAEAAVEVCDGLPSYVEGHCANFGMGYYCPWSAVMIELRDCRFDLRCPMVPR